MRPGYALSLSAAEEVSQTTKKRLGLHRGKAEVNCI
jgi:hypothetical protein